MSGHRIQAKLIECPECHHVDHPAAFGSVPWVDDDCEHCGDRFQSTQPRARFCSRTCQLAALRERRRKP
jgi:hypothetical protein